jgi:hypothetical protein
MLQHDVCATRHGKLALRTRLASNVAVGPEIRISRTVCSCAGMQNHILKLLGFEIAEIYYVSVVVVVQFLTAVFAPQRPLYVLVFELTRETWTRIADASGAVLSHSTLLARYQGKSAHICKVFFAPFVLRPASERRHLGHAQTRARRQKQRTSNSRPHARHMPGRPYIQLSGNTVLFQMFIGTYVTASGFVAQASSQHRLLRWFWHTRRLATGW